MSYNYENQRSGYGGNGGGFRREGGGKSHGEYGGKPQGGFGGGRNQGGGSQDKVENCRNITETNYVDEAEAVIKKIKNENLTTSKIRNLLSLSSDIYNELASSKNSSDELSQDVISRIEYLRVRFLYEAGRDSAVEAFVKEAGIPNFLKNKINGSRKNFMLFNRYMEALVAYHRYYGGKDK